MKIQRWLETIFLVVSLRTTESRVVHNVKPNSLGVNGKFSAGIRSHADPQLKNEM